MSAAAAVGGWVGGGAAGARATLRKSLSSNGENFLSNEYVVTLIESCIVLQWWCGSETRSTCVAVSASGAG
jgi:hypothetical protein